MKRIYVKTHPNIERIIMIGASPFMIKLIDMFNRLRLPQIAIQAPELCRVV